MTDPSRSSFGSGGSGHAAWVEVDLSALVHNARVLRAATPAGAELGILVKANGYGHGSAMAARAALAGSADRLMVATLDEGLALRAAGVGAPILVVYPVPDDGLVEATQANLELSVSGLDSTRMTIAAWSRSREGLPDRVLRLHLEVDSGMGRGGVAPERAAEAVRAIADEPCTSVAGVWSHLADGRDAAMSGEQVRRFEEALAGIGATTQQIPTRHLLATEGLFAATAPAYDMVRIGLGFYGELGLGFEPHPRLAGLASDLRPAMAIKARPIRVEDLPAGARVGYGGEWIARRPSRIATLPIGYADGWTRSSWPGGRGLVHGRRVPLVGRVSMDSVCADVTDVGDVTPDDEVVLLGVQAGQRITANEVAQLRGSIPNEVLSGLGPRLPRRYVGELE